MASGRARARADVLSRPEFISLVDTSDSISSLRGRRPRARARDHCRESVDARREQLQLPEADCMLLGPSLGSVTLRALIAADLSASRRLAQRGPKKGAFRSGTVLLHLSGHGAVWLVGTILAIYRSTSAAAREVLGNLLLHSPFLHCLFASGLPPVRSTSLLFDFVIVTSLKALVRRRHPPHGSGFSSSSVYSSPIPLPSRWVALLPSTLWPVVAAVSYSFPAGQAARAALVMQFLLHHLVLAFPIRVLLIMWVIAVGLLRVSIGAHRVSDVVTGFLLGYHEYGLIRFLWISAASCQTLLGIVGFSPVP
uniref:inactive phospholipid phosphatase 7-like n=1 Tax=Myxine glutinosa TaxID=7769 RepID=UPI00358DE862